MKVITATFLCLFLTVYYSYGQVEICDNGIDDDNDGLIDCFDNDCCNQGDCTAYWFNSCGEENCLFQGSENFTISSRTISSEDGFAEFSNIVVGDLNGDGIGEIITSLNNRTVIVDPATENIITTPFSFTIGFDAYAIGDIVSSSPGPELLINNGNSTRVLDPLGNIIYNTNLSDFSQVLNLTDYNQDGRPEFHTESVIYDGETGNTLIDLPEIPNQLAESSNAIAVDVLDDAYCNTCDGLEHIASGFIYAIDIANQSYVIQKDYRFEHSTGIYFSAVIDWDLDGDLDLFTMSFSDIIVIDIATDSILFSTTKNAVKNGIINIGNLDDDPFPEFSYITEENLGTLYVFDNDLSLIWSKLVKDDSGFTGLSLFDFDADGQSEIVYRDEDNLRIINATTGNDIQLMPCTSPTGDEFPIIVDYDNDQEAEIITICDGELTVFSSGSGSPWADCRSVWNQRNYFNVHIEEDLSIPRVQQKHHLPGNLNLNSFLNQYQVPEYIDIDLNVTNTALNTSCDEIIITVCNEGAENFSSDFPISFYTADPSLANASLITTQLYPALSGGTCIDAVYVPPSGFTGPIWFILNDSGLIPPQNFEDELPNTSLKECEYANNIDSISVMPCISPEICNNGIDDDNDGAIDCDDSDCQNLVLNLLESPICGIVEATICNEGGATINENISISLYESSGNIAISLISTQSALVNLLPGDCQSYILNISSQYTGDIIVSINDSGINGLPIDLDENGTNRDIEECLFEDNWSALSISLNPIQLDLGNDILVCDQSQFTIMPQDGYVSYTWDGSILDQDFTVNATGIYRLEVTDACGQSSADQIEITFDQEKITTETIRLCQGDSILQQGEWIQSDDQLVEVRKSFATACDSIYQFQVEELSSTNFSITETICSNDSFYYSPLDSFLLAGRTYDFILTNAAGCDSLLSISIDTYSFDFSYTSSETCLGIEDGSILLNLTDPSLVQSIEWSTGDSDMNAISGLAPGNYTVTIIDIFNCTYVESIIVDEIASSNFEVVFEDASCEIPSGNIAVASNPDIVLIELDGAVIDSDETITLPAGESELLITDLFGCEYPYSFLVNEYPSPMIDYPDTIWVMSNTDQAITAFLNGDYIYSWSGSPFLSCLDCQDPSINTDSDVLLNLNVSTPQGCDTSILVQIIVNTIEPNLKLYLPNAFNPNSSNDANSGFQIFSNQEIDVPVALKVYDRWGNLIYSYEGIANQLYWDGSYKGEALNPGVFSYILQYVDGSEKIKKAGSFALLR